MPALTLRQIWLGVPIFILTLKAFLFPLPLLDFWWHLRMGQIIFETHSIPRADIFSFTASGKHFIVQNWLAEVVYYATHLAGGFPLLIFLNAVLLVATLIPIYYLCRKASDALWSSVFAASLVSASMICNMRPQGFSFLLFAIYYWLLSDFHYRRKDRIWLLPLLMILWVNLHGAFVLGLVLVVAFLISEAVAARPAISGTSSPAKSRATRLALVLGLCMVATLVNPEIHGVFSYVVTVMKDPSSQQFVVEWQPPDMATVQGIMLFYLPFFLTTLALILSRKRPNLAELVLYAGFSAFGLMATRNAAWFLLVCAPLLARHLPLGDWKSVVAGSVDSGPRRLIRRKQSPVLNHALVAVALIILAVQSPWVQTRFYANSLLEKGTPVGAVDQIEKLGLEGNIFHPQIYGDYLIWRLWPQVHSFIDGRVHLFGPEVVGDYQKIYRDSHREELLDKYHIQYLLLSKQSDRMDDLDIVRDMRRSPAWKVIYENEQSIIFGRSTATSM